MLLKQHLSAEEDTKTAALIRELRPARARGYLTREELEKVCRWKSARAIRLTSAHCGVCARRGSNAQPTAPEAVALSS
jgi:hypothetical protein